VEAIRKTIIELEARLIDEEKVVEKIKETLDNLKKLAAMTGVPEIVSIAKTEPNKISQTHSKRKEAHNAYEDELKKRKSTKTNEKKEIPRELGKYHKSKSYHCKSCDHQFEDSNPKMCPLCQSSLIREN